jgi:hypothetical protein
MDGYTNNDWKKVIFANDWKKINNGWKEIYALIFTATCDYIFDESRKLHLHYCAIVHVVV